MSLIQYQDSHLPMAETVNRSPLSNTKLILCPLQMATRIIVLLTKDISLAEMELIVRQRKLL